MMNLLDKPSKLQIITPMRLTPYLRQELEALGYPVRNETAMSVETEGRIEDAMRLNLYLFNAHRVLFFLQEFRARDPEELYRNLSRFDWENYLYEDGYISVNSHVEHHTINDTRFPNMKAKDAIVDRMQAKRRKRPNSGPDRTGAVIYLYWKNDVCQVYFDTSGENLAHRGYRKIPGAAPMQESLASGSIFATGWNENENFINPMCGSGTLAIEAALRSLHQAPGILRKNFGFMHIKGYNYRVWNRLKDEAKQGAKKTTAARIIATDHDPKAIWAARQNAELAKVEPWIEFQICDFKSTPIPEGGGVVILNPGYGERIGELDELQSLYHEIGDFFKKQCQGYRGYIFTGNPELAKVIGLKAKRKIPFFNATIDCRLMEYELYSGTRKQSKLKAMGLDTEEQD